MFFGVLPLRAIAFQTLFLMLAISLEALILYWQLEELDYKTSIRYSTSINLLSTVVGWILFLNIQVFLPEELRLQLISYFFFERFFPSPWATNVAPVLTVFTLGTFIAVFLLEFEGLRLLEIFLEKAKPQEAQAMKKRLRSSNQGLARFKENNQAYAVFIANACSFSAILFLLFIRWLENAT